MTSKQALLEIQETLYRSKNPTRRYLHCARRDWLLAKLAQYTQARATHEAALEVGPGSGLYLPELAQRYQRATAVDIEAAYLEHAQPLLDEHPNLRLQIDDMTDSELDSDQFDLVLCTEVIEHTPNSAQMLAEIQRVLKHGGVLLLSTPQAYSPLELTAKIAFLPGIIQLVRWIYQEAIVETGHINLLRESQVRRQLAAAGLEIVETHKSGVYLPLLAEFTGEFGLKIEQWLEQRMRGSWLDGLLWTQYYVVTKPE